ncbi:MAG: HNH endonuclease [Deltaproteobacteria bacterium]|nr:HNH endonuclease [Deltaproteobacteria bacterium]
MNIDETTRLQVRERAQFSCEYCGVTETDTGGELTVDHFRPQSKDGTDDLANLLYCCPRCNQYKADYWSADENEPHLWNPRKEAFATHLLMLTDGTLYSITPIGAFTLRRLRLNRPPLVALRLRRYHHSQEQRLLARYRDLVTVLEQLQTQQVTLLEEQRKLLEEQRVLLKLLLEQRR